MSKVQLHGGALGERPRPLPLDAGDLTTVSCRSVETEQNYFLLKLKLTSQNSVVEF